MARLEIVEVNGLQVDVDINNELAMAKALIDEKPVKIESEPDYEYACNYLVEVKSLRTKIEDKFAPILEKIKAVKAKVEHARKVVVGAIGDSTKELVEVEQSVRDLASSYRMKIEEERKKAAEEAKKEEVAVKTVEEMQAQKTEKSAGVQMREVWKYKASDEPLDPAYTTKDELGFTIPDHKKIREMVNKYKGACSIQGVMVYKVYETAVKRKK